MFELVERGQGMMGQGGNMMPGCGGSGMMMHGGGFSILHMIGATLFGLAFLAIVIIAAVWLYRLMKAHTARFGCCKTPTTAETALDILSRRYAEGVIDTAEYLERKQHLTE